MLESKPPAELVLPLDALELIDKVCLRFEDAWKKGSNPSLAEYAAGSGPGLRSALLCELLKIELHYRNLSGQPVPLNHYLSLFPGEGRVVEAAFSTVKLVKIATSADTPAGGETQTFGPVPLPSIPGYQLLGVLGRGGMGVVYKADQVGLKRIVALKMVLHADHSSPEIRARFHREAESLARIKHENIVEVYEIGEFNGTPFYSMEYVEGGSLNHYLERTPLPPRFAAQLVQNLARAIQVAHQSGVIHRDLKPANILLAFAHNHNPANAARDGEPPPENWHEHSFVPKITDFGLAKRAEDSMQTQSGAVLGTPSYMAPEQAMGSAVHISPATDVYALGAILYELLTGRPPFKGATPGDAFWQLLQTEPKQLRAFNSAIPRELEAVCLKCLEKHPRLRYPTAEALADDLQHWLRGDPTVAQPPGWPSRLWRWCRNHQRISAALIVAPLLAVAIGVALYFTDPQRQLEDIEARLAQGQVVSLIGESGGPRWSAWASGSKESQAAAAENGAFSLHSSDLALLELVHKPPPAYSLSAEINHVAAKPHGQVGLFFAHKKNIGNPGITYFYQLSFNDVIDINTLFPPGNIKGNPLTVAIRYGLSSDAASPGFHSIDALTAKLFKPAIVASAWRKVLINVDPGGVEVYWEGQPAKALSSTLIDQWTAQYIASMPKSYKGFAGAIAPRFDSSGSVGLFVVEGSASFRRVVIEMRHGN